MANILIIDDDVQILWVLRKMLEKHGHTVISASDGEKGQQLYRKAHYDILITDMIMPNKSGINLISEILQEFPEARIIAISGGGAIEAQRYLEVALSIGARKCISKPFSMKSLLDAVDEVLSSPSAEG